ncbi:beta-lactamase-like protein [Aspergillus karnatakaensis]|uniref:MBL fold metallo-hydrolase n=1 Tax=Aspergillus karnatakaensis TaxID=1810916 RepID=UPI003CCE53F6
MASFTPVPLTPPDLRIPTSTAIVTVRVIDTTTTLHLKPSLFWTPEIPSLTGIDAPTLSFLISSETQSKHVLFDLGVRKDWENYAPATVDLIKKTTKVTVHKNIAEILDDDDKGCSVKSTDISALIWSHHHFDHIGDPSTFPPATALIVGPGAKQFISSGYPTRPEATTLDSDTKGREILELDFTPSNPQACKVGRFNAVDYFGDGSFYLLDAPGHSVGHICALTRVTSAPDSFIFMGGDAAHHPGLIRPSAYLPIPKVISPSPFKHGLAPSQGVIRGIYPAKSLTEPFLKLARGMFPDYEAAEDTLGKIQELDAQEDILVILPHDRSILGGLEVFPGNANQWRTQGVKEKVRWAFLVDFEATL